MNWEYRTIRVKTEGMLTPNLDNLNDDIFLGNEGWELAVAVPMLDDGKTEQVYFYLKRPRQE